MKTLLPLTLAATLAGCMSFEYRKDGADAARRTQDEKECAFEADKATAGIRNGIEAGWAKGELEMKCMDVRGYQRVRTK